MQKHVPPRQERPPLDFIGVREKFLSVKIFNLGDSALVLDFGDEAADPKAQVSRALSAAAAIESARIEGVLEITAAYQTVSLFLAWTRPREIPLDNTDLIENITQAISAEGKLPASPQRTIEIPVCYDEEFALDGARVANETKLPMKKIVELHSASKFTVVCIGFMPGFPYLAGLPAELRTPRQATPRTEVPAGSVAIANRQAGIYPFESPGGWNIIGRTPLRLFDPAKTPPTLLTAGDKVRFRKISRAEFETINCS
jgi:inhibitor of KinA